MTNAVLNSLKDALKVAPQFDQDDDGFAEAHQVIRHFAMRMYPQDDKAKLMVTSGLWLHVSGSWYWGGTRYASDVWAYVRKGQDPNSPGVAVDRVCAYLQHHRHYGYHEKCEQNAAAAHAAFRYTGVPAHKTGITFWGCAEHSGYGRWCTDRGSA